MGNGTKSYLFKCRHCDNSCHRHGKTYKKQRYKCSVCGITQFRVYKSSSVFIDRTTIIKRLNSENVGIRGIARLTGLSPTHVIRCIFQLASLVKRPDYYESGQEYELDELWSYSKNKKNSQWVVWAINRKTRVVIDFVIGRRTKATVSILIEKLKKLNPKKIRTDQWPGYDDLFSGFPKGVHQKGRRITNRIERQGANYGNRKQD